MFKNISNKTWTAIIAVIVVVIVAVTFISIQHTNNKKADDCCNMDHKSMSMKSGSSMKDCCDMDHDKMDHSKMDMGSSKK
ncbi:hypothetical protein G6R29_05220 [Fructobacillus sp. M2-14]|uniref:Uncharacterized protein n=1 Tax=Fructobacillus broussonetiae TaxID=2713173 RepID=A0ABS5R239_9LACO|nr:hypothetical protein [Fructobacillus broussonetiae]MBS9339020.1 hypothetical protein [Fructobacillus broussonetiae]